MTEPRSGDYYLTPAAFWKLVLTVYTAGVVTACGVFVTWVAFLAAAVLLSFGLGLDISIHELPDGDRRRRAP